MIGLGTNDALLDDAVQGPRGGVFSRLEPLCAGAIDDTGPQALQWRRQGRCAPAPVALADARIASP